jgi:hypothetical protein
MTNILKRGLDAWDRRMSRQAIPYWNTKESYANGWVAGYRAAQAAARSKANPGAKQ